MYNLITPKQVLKLLIAIHKNPILKRTILPALPIAGIDGTLSGRMHLLAKKRRLRAKTGTLTGVSNIAGYCNTQHHGKLMFVDQHLDRLFEGSKAIDLDIGLTKEELIEAITYICKINEMTSGVHIRLVVTRGIKKTPFQSPRANTGKSTIVIIPEWKEVSKQVIAEGIKLHTVHIQRGNPTVQDPLWNSLSKLNCISACIQAEKAGADEALMLNPNGFISTCNSTHFFIIRNQELWTSNGLYCIEGITRGNIISLAKKLGLLVKECDFSLTKAYSADEAFVTGTFAGLIPVNSIDGRKIGNLLPGLITKRLIKAYKSLFEENSK